MLLSLRRAPFKRPSRSCCLVLGRVSPSKHGEKSPSIGRGHASLHNWCFCLILLLSLLCCVVDFEATLHSNPENLSTKFGEPSTGQNAHTCAQCTKQGGGAPQ